MGGNLLSIIANIILWQRFWIACAKTVPACPWNAGQQSSRDVQFITDPLPRPARHQYQAFDRLKRQLKFSSDNAGFAFSIQRT